MITKQELRAAKALLSDPSRWTKAGMFYEGHFGAPDCKYCIVGAIMAVGGKYNKEIAFKLARQSLGGIYDFNDAPETTHEMLMAKFDDLIAAAPEAV